MGVASLFGFVEASHTQESPVTAIDILLEPDATMVQHARADNARLLKAYPTGFALDPTQPHLTLIQQFVRTADLAKVCVAANQVLAKENAASWNLKAFRYYYIPVPPNGIAGIVVEPTEELLRLQRRLLDAIAPFAEKTGTAAAFVSADDGRDIQDGLIDYVANFGTVADGRKFNPHVT
jgi:2'-5' RNA ligase